MWDADKYRDPFELSRPCCMICRGFGYHLHVTDKEGIPIPRWCSCDAASDRRVAEPDLLETLNAEQQRFAQKFLFK